MTEPAVVKNIVDPIAVANKPMPPLPGETEEVAAKQGDPLQSASKRLSVFIDKAKKTIEKVTSPDNEQQKQSKRESTSGPVSDPEPGAAEEVENHQSKASKRLSKLLLDNFFSHKNPAQDEKVPPVPATTSTEVTAEAETTVKSSATPKEGVISLLRRNTTKLFAHKTEATAKEVTTDEPKAEPTATTSTDTPPDESSKKKLESSAAQLGRRLTKILGSIPTTAKIGKNKASDDATTSSPNAAVSDAANTEAPPVPEKDTTIHPTATTSTAPVVQATA